MSGWWDPSQELASPFGLLLAGLFVLLALVFVSVRRRWSRARGPSLSLPSQPFVHGFDLLLDARWLEAMQVLVNAVRADPDRVLEYLELAKLFRRRAQPGRAARMFQHLLARSTLDHSLQVVAHYELGLAYREMGLPAAAAAALEQVLSIDPFNGEARRELRRTHEEMACWGKAVAVEKIRLKRGETTEPRTLAALRTQQGKSAWAAGELRKSMAHFRAALGLDPHCTPAVLELGRLLLQQGKVRKAFRIWLAQLEPEYLYLVFRDMHGAFQRLQREAGWETFLCAFTERYPEDPNGHLALAEWYESQDRPEDASASLRRVLEIDPVCQEAYLALLNLSRKQGAPPEVLAAYEMIVRALPRLDHPRFRCRACAHSAAEPFWKCPSCHTWATPERLLPSAEGRPAAMAESLQPASSPVEHGSALIPLAGAHASARATARMQRNTEHGR